MRFESDRAIIWLAQADRPHRLPDAVTSPGPCSPENLEAMKASWNNIVIAESDDTMLVEGNAIEVA